MHQHDLSLLGWQSVDCTSQSFQLFRWFWIGRRRDILSQLLAGVRVSDIRRIGFASPRTSDWMLEAYELEINGKPFAADTTGIPEPDPAQEALQAKLDDLDQKLVGLQKEYEELEATAKANEATEEIQERIEEVEAVAIELFKQKDLLESQVKVNPKSAEATREADLAKLDKVDTKIQTLLWEMPAEKEEAEAAAQDAQDATQDAPPPPEPVPASAVPQDAETLPPLPQDTQEAAQQAQPAGQDDQAALPDAMDVEEVEAQVNSLLEQKTLLEGRLQGIYPWFVDEQFSPALSAEAAVEKAKITLETYDHAAADTNNYVYFRTGGHKYLLNARYLPLTADGGPQEFEIDLVAGPVSAAELRGWAVGMLAVPDAQGQVPDRWHPQRVLVEIDDSIVYDSEEYPLDRQSLEAIRVIPPAQLDEDGTPLAAAPCAREIFLWEAGKGLGLDLNHRARYVNTCVGARLRFEVGDGRFGCDGGGRREPHALG